MDIRDLGGLLEENMQELTQILNDCNEGPDELVLLATKMQALLDDFKGHEQELLASLPTSDDGRKSSEDQAAVTEK